MKIEKGKLYLDTESNALFKSDMDIDNYPSGVSDKIAVHCPTKEDWEYVRSKGYALCGYRQYSGSGLYYNLYKPYWSSKKEYDSLGYCTLSIDQFKEFYPEEDKFAELKEDHKNGAVIQIKERNGEWYSISSPQWDSDAEYRIKPEEEQKELIVELSNSEPYDDPYNWGSIIIDTNNYRNNNLEAKEDEEILKRAKDRAIEQDKINPHHYNSKGIQPIDYIEANNMSFNEGNVIKYVTRYKLVGTVS